MELAHHDVVFSESRLALHTHLRALLAVPSNALTPPSTPLGPGAGAGAAAAGAAAGGALGVASALLLLLRSSATLLLSRALPRALKRPNVVLLTSARARLDI